MTKNETNELKAQDIWEQALRMSLPEMLRLQRGEDSAIAIADAVKEAYCSRFMPPINETRRCAGIARAILVNARTIDADHPEFKQGYEVAASDILNRIESGAAIYVEPQEDKS